MNLQGDTDIPVDVVTPTPADEVVEIARLALLQLENWIEYEGWSLNETDAVMARLAAALSAYDEWRAGTPIPPKSRPS